jgi:hypothetical protein
MESRAAGEVTLGHEAFAEGRHNVRVIPGPPQAEPGIQPLMRKKLDSGFALARAPE